MKKLLSKIEHVPSGQGTCIGRTLALQKHNVSVEEVIAEGGFGVVFLVRQGSQKFALKRIVVNNEHDLAVATREIQIMTSLGDHPNLLGCLDFIITPLGGGVTEALCLMPFCRGSLLALLNSKMGVKGHLAEKEVLSIFGDVVCGVARLHQCGTPIIHRDLKVENVLEEESGKFLLCDFGSATPKFWDPVVHGVPAIQEDLDKYTTLAYRSPEMVDLYSGRGPITTKSDIWALGVLLYKMCFYTTPFGDSILAIQSANLSFPSNSPFSAQLHALIHYMLAPDANQRPDVYQVSELVFPGLLGLTNPVSNVGGVASPLSLDSLVGAMTAALTAAKVKSEEKSVKSSTSVTPGPAAGPLETSVTPRQRPKGSIVLSTPAVGAALLPPPKSPKPLDPSHTNSHNNFPTPPANNNSALAAAAVPPPPPVIPPPNNDIGHRRNASDSSAFEKGLTTVQQSDMASASSEQAISSWNPFEDDSAFAAAAAMAATAPSSGVDPSGAAGDDDPFANAPFDYFKYRPMGVDLFGAAPFSNPFIEFSQPDGGELREGVTNLCFEDER